MVLWLNDPRRFTSCTQVAEDLEVTLICSDSGAKFPGSDGRS